MLHIAEFINSAGSRLKIKPIARLFLLISHTLSAFPVGATGEERMAPNGLGQRECALYDRSAYSADGVRVL